MEDWTEDGDRVGWFPSVPFYLEVVQPPAAVRGLDADETRVGQADAGPLPADPERDQIVIARTAGAGAPQPTAGTRSHVLATIPGGCDVVHRLHRVLVLDLTSTPSTP